MNTEFGKKIKKLREKAEMTQTDLAKELGLSKSVISAYEKGIRNPSFTVLKDICNIFNIHEVYFLTSNDQSDNGNLVDITDLESNQQAIIESLVRQFRYDNYRMNIKK